MRHRVQHDDAPDVGYRAISMSSAAAPIVRERISQLALCCPLCKGALEEGQNPPAYACPGCDRTYPVVHGIPDFRVWPDPYIAADADWAKGERVWCEGGGRFAPMLEAYWRLTPDVPMSMASRFVRYALVGAARGMSRCRRIGEIRGRRLGAGDVLLDVGCGSGGLVAAASRQVGAVVGVDIAARWLTVAQAQLAEAGVDNALLVCACAEYLPFPDGTFTVAVANDVLEHCQEQPRLLGELRRTLEGRGLLLLSTQNRWSLRGEPHVGVWGVGFLPRRWMEPYVRWARGVPYRLIRLVSRSELGRLLRRAGFGSTRQLLPEVAPEELDGLAPGERRLIGLYQVLSRLPVLRSVLLELGPILEVAAHPAVESQAGF
jgi:SAM-dependent methyltransferase